MSALINNPSDILTPQARKMSSDSGTPSEGERVEGRVRELYQKGKDKAVEAEENFESYVRAHPVKSVLIATGVGLAFGYLLTRKR